MRTRNGILAIVVIFVITLHCPLILKANISITARYLLSSADSVALTIASDAELLLVNSTDVDRGGKAASWNYLYSSIANRKEYYFHSENTAVIYDSSKDMRVGIAPVDSNWIDSDSALYLAELSGGEDFRTIYPESQISAVLYKIVYPPFDTYWDILYIGTDSSISIRINAITGKVITPVNQNINKEDLPTSYVLFQNYPNPFNSQTKIRFKMSHSSYVILRIMNMNGQEVKSLIKETKFAGNYEVIWNGKDNYGKQVSSGIYFYKFECQDFSVAYKMTLLR